ncbi:MAG: nicotinate-nicotinamide nucleotide adenylyltransferase [Planctomycetota bacterium]
MSDQTPITPWPARTGAPCLLFGGSFDPPHLAHVRLSRLALARARPTGTLVIVPAARSPHKPDGPVASDADRLAMVRLAWAGYADTAVWTDELDRAADAPSYWIETLRRAAEITRDSLAFLIGADQAAALHRWKDAREILALAEPVIAPREPISDRDALRSRLRDAGFWSQDESDRLADAFRDDLPTVPGSSTDVRGGAPGLVPAAVEDYARRHALYGLVPPVSRPPT